MFIKNKATNTFKKGRRKSLTFLLLYFHKNSSILPCSTEITRSMQIRKRCKAVSKNNAWSTKLPSGNDLFQSPSNSITSHLVKSLHITSNQLKTS